MRGATQEPGQTWGQCVACGYRPINYVEGCPPLCVTGKLVPADESINSEAVSENSPGETIHCLEQALQEEREAVSELVRADLERIVQMRPKNSNRVTTAHLMASRAEMALAKLGSRAHD
jgi:hypothetical protein